MTEDNAGLVAQLRKPFEGFSVRRELNLRAADVIEALEAKAAAGERCHAEERKRFIAAVGRQSTRADDAERELRARELHHFEGEQAMTTALEELLVGSPGRILRAVAILQEATGATCAKPVAKGEDV